MITQLSDYIKDISLAENHKHFILYLGRGFIATQDACCIVVNDMHNLNTLL